MIKLICYLDFVILNSVSLNVQEEILFPYKFTSLSAGSLLSKAWI